MSESTSQIPDPQQPTPAQQTTVAILVLILCIGVVALVLYAMWGLFSAADNLGEAGRQMYELGRELMKEGERMKEGQR